MFLTNSSKEILPSPLSSQALISWSISASVTSAAWPVSLSSFFTSSPVMKPDPSASRAMNAALSSIALQTTDNCHHFIPVPGILPRLGCGVKTVEGVGRSSGTNGGVALGTHTNTKNDCYVGGLLFESIWEQEGRLVLSEMPEIPNIYTRVGTTHVTAMTYSLWRSTFERLWKTSYFHCSPFSFDNASHSRKLFDSRDRNLSECTRAGLSTCSSLFTLFLSCLWIWCVSYILAWILKAIMAAANSSKLRFPDLSVSASLMMNCKTQKEDRVIPSLVCFPPFIPLPIPAAWLEVPTAPQIIWSFFSFWLLRGFSFFQSFHSVFPHHPSRLEWFKEILCFILRHEIRRTQQSRLAELHDPKIGKSNIWIFPPMYSFHVCYKAKLCWYSRFIKKKTFS